MWNRQYFFNILLWAVAFSSVSLMSQAIHAATITVNASVGGASCTLIRAIDSANANSDAPGCAAVRTGDYGDDIILLPFSHNVHALTTANNNAAGPTGLPSITSSITIQSSPGAVAIISIAPGVPYFRLFHIDSMGSLTLNDLRLFDGWATDNNSLSITSADYGGAAYNAGELNINRCAIRFNNAAKGGGGLYNSGTLRITQSEITYNNGGGIYNTGNLLLADSDISHNDNGPSSQSGVGSGGGLYNAFSGTTSISRTLFHDNRASAAGGIFNQGILSAKDSTLSANTSYAIGGALFLSGTGTTSLTNVTIVDNFATDSNGGGGIYHFSGTLNLMNTLVSGNDTLDASGAEIVRIPSAIINNQQHNLLGSRARTNAQAFVGFSPVASDITATFNGSKPTNQIDIIKPLNSNGGPTKTHALAPNSPAINAGISSFGFPFPVEGCYVPRLAGFGGYYRDDQRGVRRPQEAACDIGAYEYVRTKFFIIPVPGGKAVIFGL